jgi:hypothetical protein
MASVFDCGRCGYVCNERKAWLGGPFGHQCPKCGNNGTYSVRKRKISDFPKLLLSF